MKYPPELVRELEKIRSLILTGSSHDISTRADVLVRQNDQVLGKELFRCLARSQRTGHLELLLQLVAANLNPWIPLFELAEGVAERADMQGFVSALSSRMGSTEFFAVLLQTLVCHGVDFEQVADAQVFRDELLERGHRLGLLPLRPTSLEHALVLSPKGFGEEPRFKFPPSNPAQALAPQVAAVVDAPGAIRDATRTWSRWETLQVVLDARHASPLDLRSLPLASLRGGGLREAETTASEIFARLFDAASQGGFPDSPGSGAHGLADGRLVAFTTLAAFVDGTTLGDVPGLVARAEQCRWWLWDGTSWFGGLNWDLGAACLRPDGITLVAHAATEA